MKFADTFVAGETVIEIVYDDITNANTEIIVNSICNKIHIGSGVSGAIKEKAGSDVYNELKKNPGKFNEGEIYLTSAGNLPYKYIFHAISSNCHTGTTAEILRSCVENTLKTAREKKIGSVGFPAFGTGDMNFSINAAAEILINTVIDACFNNHSIERIVFYLFRPDAFTAFFRNAVKATIQAQQTKRKDKNKFLLGIEHCDSGLSHQAKYESLIADAFNAIFVPPLAEYQQITRKNGYSFNDLIYSNACTEGFWNTLDRRYDVKYVIVNCNNQNSPKVEDTIVPLNKYFKSGLYGKFGMVVCRKISNSSEYRNAVYSSYMNHGSIILSIDDFDLFQLIELSNTNYEPEKYLQRKLAEQLLQLDDLSQEINILDVVRELIIKGEIGNAFDELRNYSRIKNTSITDDVVALSSRNRMNETNYFIHGIISYDDYRLEFNKIIYGVELLLKDL